MAAMAPRAAEGQELATGASACVSRTDHAIRDRRMLNSDADGRADVNVSVRTSADQQNGVSQVAAPCNSRHVQRGAIQLRPAYACLFSAPGACMTQHEELSAGRAPVRTSGAAGDLAERRADLVIVEEPRKAWSFRVINEGGTEWL
jgi:hypothetical protein